MLASRRFFAVMREVIVAALFAVSAPVLTANSAFAQLQGTQTQGTIAPIPVAIPLFLGDDPQMAGEISNVVQADLDLLQRKAGATG